MTIRSLPDEVHAKLRRMAGSAGTSVEALVRGILAEATMETPRPPGMSEASAPWIVPAKQLLTAAPDLWGALPGCIQPATGADLTAPTGEAWKADS